MSVAALAPIHTPSPHIAMSASKRTMQPRPNSAASTSMTAKPTISVKARPTLVQRPSTSTATPRQHTSPLPTPSSSSTPLTSGNKDTSSSSGKVFAKPSKEWVLPERAKPGRKVSVEEPDNKRQSQNRLSQRAHRARRTDYIQTLEERLRQYEADEIHSNVRLQEVARALKADNERLKKETVTLRLEINEFHSQRDAWDTERASYEELVGRLSSELKTLRGDTSSPQFIRRVNRHQSVSSPRVMPTLVPNIERGPVMDCPICPDPDPDCPCQQRDTITTLPALRPTAPLAALHLAVKAMAEQAPSPTPGGSTCGVCETADECLCRALDEEDVKPVIFPTPSPEIDLGAPSDGCGLCTSASFCACKASANANPNASSHPVQSQTMGIVPAATTIYPTPPGSTGAVPLRLGRIKSKAAPIWTLDPPKVEAECSGDPSNCDACRDDSFGKEFCSNLFEKTETQISHKPCGTCPGDCMSINSLLCSSSSPESAESHPRPFEQVGGGVQTTQTPSTVPGVAVDHNGETMTCDQAWKALKAHPNSKFASLSLLADVVAGRTVCTGPRLESASSVPASPVSHASPVSIGSRPDAGSPHTYKPSSLGPGVSATPLKRRNMAVETSAVRDALRMLDNTSQESRTGGSETKKRKIE